jgi:hypothetical protein
MTTKKTPAKKRPAKTAAPKKKTGRPSAYNLQIAGKICNLIAGGSSLRNACSQEGMPSTASVLRWLAEHEDFRGQYARATDARADLMADEMIEIADDARNDFIEKARDNGETFIVADQEHIARSRLRIDTRKWLASKMAPKKYGDKVQAEVSGPEGGAIPVAVTVSFVKANHAEPEPRTASDD